MILLFFLLLFANLIFGDRKTRVIVSWIEVPVRYSNVPLDLYLHDSGRIQPPVY
jgi:hypothetical protein